jgi:hypothetical protein
MTADEIAADLKDYASRKKKVNDLYEAAMKNPDVLPKGITTDQLRLAVKGDPVTGQRVPPNFSVKNGKLSTDINQAKKQFADFQADLKKIFDEEGITDAKVVQLGSGTSGWSTAPGKTGKPWSPKSDVDFAIFSDEALAQAKRQGAGINPKNMQAGKYTTIKNKNPGGTGFHKTSLGKKLRKLELKWNEKIYGDTDVDGFDFKLNLQTDKPFKSAVPVI